MKRIAVLGAIVASGLVSVGVTAQGLPGITDIEHVAGNVHKIFGAGGNTVVFERENDVVLVDTKLPGSGDGILAEVRKVTDKPIGMIINTHSHPDHIGANAFFQEGETVQVVAHANSEARMEQEGGPFPPNEVHQSFDDFLAIGEGDDRIEVYHFGAGHTDGDAFIYFPAASTVMTGDVYAWHMSPLIDPLSGGSMIALPTTVTGAYYGLPDAEVWIQGHGYISTRAEFLSFVTFNRALTEAAEQAVQFDRDECAALANLERNPNFQVFLHEELLPGLEYGGTPRSRALINITVAMQELRGEEPQLIMGLPPGEPICNDG